jgi:hypothetical protein
MFMVVTKRLRLQGFIITDHYDWFGEFAAQARVVRDGRLGIGDRIAGIENAPARFAERTSGRCSSRSVRTSDAALPLFGHRLPAAADRSSLPSGISVANGAASAFGSAIADSRQPGGRIRPATVVSTATSLGVTRAAEWGDCALRGAALV